MGVNQNHNYYNYTYSAALFLMMLQLIVNNMGCSQVIFQLLVLSGDNSNISDSSDDGSGAKVFHQIFYYPLVSFFKLIAQVLLLWRVQEYNAFQWNGYALGIVHT